LINQPTLLTNYGKPIAMAMANSTPMSFLIYWLNVNL
jgi:hypothetical protein